MPNPMGLDLSALDGLDEYATDRQREILQAIRTYGSGRQAAAALGITHSTTNETIRRLKEKAAKRGWSPQHDMTHAVPEPYVVRGVSTYYDGEGNPRGQWVKSQLDSDKLRIAQEAAAKAFAEELPRLPALPNLGHPNEALLNLYTMTDCHVGMLAWRRETGENWDLGIAEKTLVGCFEQMLATAPNASHGIVCQLGDFLHFDGMEAVTPTSGHLLDADGRFEKVVEAAIRILRILVDWALQKHDTLTVIMAEGNHDISASVWLRASFAAIYENEPRVTVNTSPLPYYAHQHGRTMLAFHHGHLKKFKDLPLLMAAQFPEMWGQTKFRFAHTGHWHHVREEEHNGIRLVQHPTLAARDAYAARSGFVSARTATCYTYHREYGQVASNTVSPDMLEEA